MSNLPGGAILAKMLQAEGVDTVFGIIDGTYFGLYSAFKEHGIRLITPRHETCAAHMAAAYARRTGRLGVCMASNGPGVANILPGVAVENGEGNRVLLLTSCRRTGIGYPDRGGTYQYFDQTAVTKPMTKWSGAVPSHDRLYELMRRALRVVHTGRPGVVHLDVPESIMNGKGPFDPAQIRPPKRYRRVEPIVADEALVDEAARLLVAAERPMIHAGSGVIHAGAYAELARVAEQLAAPVTTSWAARGVLPETADEAIPMVHIELNNRVRTEADTCLVLGSRVGETDWWGKPPYWRDPDDQVTIQVDVDDEILGLNKPVDLAVLADAKAFLTALSDKLRVMQGRIDLRGRREILAGYRDAAAADRAKLDKLLDKKTDPINPALVGRLVQEVMPEPTTWVFDGGNTTIWANFFHEAREPNTILSTFKFGMLGAGVSQAIGAKAADPDRTVCCVIGDGAMGFHLQEVETAVRNELPVIYVVMVDKQWGMVKLNQQISLKPVKTLIKKSLTEDETINADLNEIEFDKVAQAMGAYGERVSRPNHLKVALENARDSGRTAVIHVDVDPVAHMWAPGLKHFKDMHLEPEG